MSINIGPPSVEELRPRITVIGVGGAGGNAITNMIEAEIEGVDFIVANTDAQALNNSVAEHRIQLGPDITRGLGAGSRPEVGCAWWGRGSLTLRLPGCRLSRTCGGSLVSPEFVRLGKGADRRLCQILGFSASVAPGGLR